MTNVDNRAQIREFLATRRAKLTPEQAGLPAGSGRRRVPGLRREEVAVLAGVSTDWYVRLEKGHIVGVSDDVLEAVARALQLNDAERAHLFNLARAAKPAHAPRRPTKFALRPSVQRILDSMTTAGAFVHNGRLDILAINPLGRALYAPVFDNPAHRANIARFNFLDPSAEDFYPDWNATADTTVALLRTEAGRDPHNRELADLVGELATRSNAFRIRWGAHDVRTHRTGRKSFHHPVVGALDLDFDTMDLSGSTGERLTLTACTAEPDTASGDALALLASWAATHIDAAAEPSGRAHAG
ncbi:helix-turn-helix transcriptional regulator [Kutzneria buriramensis]|uniref:helix-turn-helix transcriptional regulator n=1 Tax=Kutzneria buriramensis TaxID=1045776 RepID=UPI00147717DF|nr:helix-turn-helix transcriptional regulator [Kutzneria buriramensis]